MAAEAGFDIRRLRILGMRMASPRVGVPDLHEPVRDRLAVPIVEDALDHRARAGLGRARRVRPARTQQHVEERSNGLKRRQAAHRGVSTGVASRPRSTMSQRKASADPGSVRSMSKRATSR